MSAPMWGERPAPHPGPDSVVWDGRPWGLADITQLRLQLRAGLADGRRPHGADEDDVERLLLVFEELTSDGLRHGRAPVRVVVTSTGTGWVIDVSDAAADSPPVPAIGRDAADGGLGLFLVGRLGAAHGWTVHDGRGHVWARVDHASSAPPVAVPSLPRPRGGSTGRSQLHRSGRTGRVAEGTTARWADGRRGRQGRRLPDSRVRPVLRSSPPSGAGVRVRVAPVFSRVAAGAWPSARSAPVRRRGLGAE